MRHFAAVILFLLLSFRHMAGQVITVLDEEDLKPVADVVITDKTGISTTITDIAGKADIALFPAKEVLCFQSFTYERTCISPEELKETGYIVKLRKKVFALNEFVISASRWEENIREVPNKISTVSRQTAEFGNPQTAADLIGLSDAVFIQKSQLGGGSPMIRGFATNRVLIVVDGVRMNNAIYREGNIHNVISIDPASVENTEIIFGPGAIVYGSDAIGGVMDFHTSRALFSTGEKTLFRSDIMTRYSTAADEKSIYAGFNAGRKKWALHAGISYTGFGDLRMGSVSNPSYTRPEYAERTGNRDTVIRNDNPLVQRYTGYDQVSFLGKLRIKTGSLSDLTWALHYSGISDIPRYDRLIQYKSGKLRYGDWYYGPQEWMMNSLQFTTARETRIYTKARITAAWQDYAESRHDRPFGNHSLNEQYEKVTALSLNADFDLNLDGGDEFIFYGAELVYNDIVSEARTRNIDNGLTAPAGSRYPNGDNSTAAVSLYSGYRNELSQKLSLTTGLRYNYSGLWSSIADNSFYGFPFTSFSIVNSALTGAAGLVYSASEAIRVSFNASTGFRAPNLDDAGKIFDSAPGVVVVPNPGLEPEYAWNADLGFAWQYGNRIGADITGFFTWLDNAMVRKDFLFNGADSIMYGGELSKVEAMTNTGSAVVAGLQANLRIVIAGPLKLTSALNLTEGKDSDGEHLRHAAPLFGSTHLLFGMGGFNADLYASYSGARKYEKMPPQEIEKPYLYASDSNGNPWSPSWATLNLRLSYNFKNWLVLNAGLENILDLRYRPYSSGIVAPGRNFIISLRVKS
jgi:hemoglobin/transferrin/lactoferrin receptor protein